MVLGGLRSFWIDGAVVGTIAGAPLVCPTISNSGSRDGINLTRSHATVVVMPQGSRSGDVMPNLC